MDPAIRKERLVHIGKGVADAAGTHLAITRHQAAGNELSLNVGVLGLFRVPQQLFLGEESRRRHVRIQHQGWRLSGNEGAVTELKGMETALLFFR
ncbi:hypothetical protein JQX13_45410 [Archangium violaceum]|uniref:hypothetical protein n=1 Tax=Archangium violaceum TaxID=83451 RepID=UPI00193B8695|nr:hypothetical protein [Archangium violaceum]QRK07210.1 hypothetical protein JQX13_45410 [Archangium violaceum]